MARKPLEPNLWTIEDVFKHMYSVPVYQRPYSWESQQVDVLLEDIFAAYAQADEIKEEGYFIGSIYIHDKGEKLKGLIQKYEIIDGQQRLTTIALLLLAVYSHALQKGATENDQTVLRIKSALWKYIARSYDKENRTVSLNSIEKQSFSDLYDECFVKPLEIKEFCEAYTVSNDFEKRVIENFKNIYSHLEKKFGVATVDEILDFAEFLLNYVQLIAIDSTCSISKAFSIFESINSKGKPLDEIDKIKTYIFSQIDEASYSQYLKLWGDLIIKTHDQLYDYLYNFIKAYICFYRQNIYIDNFKALSKNEFLRYYKKANTCDALKALLDDMNKKVDYYIMLEDIDKAQKLVNNIEFRFYYKIFINLNYKHPKPLFMRCLESYKAGELSKTNLVDIVREITKFMYEFLTISARDSKDVITMFSTIMNDIYIRNIIDRDTVINILANEFISKGITADKLKSDIINMDAYEQNKKIGVALLSLYEATTIGANGNANTSYDMAYTLLNSYGSTFSLDHLLVQTPDKNDANFKYYNEDEKLVLKSGHDFPNDIQDGMDYEQFKRIVLSKIGNLRIYYKDNNSARQNTPVQLNEYQGFTTFAKVKQRGEAIADVLVDKCMPLPVYNPSIKTVTTLTENAYPKLDKMIEYGLISPGTKIYLTIKPEDSEATLLDATFVEYKGEKMRINDWGCKLSGWKSIRIYAYTAIVGETETLHQKRIEYMLTKDEESV